MSLAPGTTFGAYQITGVLGAGGMGRSAAPATCVVEELKRRLPANREEGFAKAWQTDVESIPIAATTQEVH